MARQFLSLVAGYSPKQLPWELIFGKGKSFTQPLSPNCLFQTKSLQSYYPQGTQPFLTEDRYFLTLATFACAWSWYGLGKVVKPPKTNSQNPKIGGLGRCFSFIRYQPLVFRGCSKYLYFPWTERSGDTNKNKWVGRCGFYWIWFPFRDYFFWFQGKLDPKRPELVETLDLNPYWPISISNLIFPWNQT